MSAARHTPDAQRFRQAYRGRFQGILRWPDLDRLWARLRGDPGPWYIYAMGEPPPERPAPAGALERFIDEIDPWLRREHGEDYCGIVYVDDPERPAFVKIFDPHRLGVVCGYSDDPPPPGWILSRLPPVPLDRITAHGRRRWWQRPGRPG